MGWLSVVNVLWDLVVQSPWSTELGAPCLCVPCVRSVFPPAVIEPWLALVCQWKGLILSGGVLCRRWLYGVGFTLVGLWCLPSLPFGGVSSGGGGMMPWCGLNLALGYVPSEVLWGILVQVKVRPYLCHLVLATKSAISYNLQIAAACAVYLEVPVKG